MRVYKFLPAEYARKDIAQRRLKISTFGEMNDPFELSGLMLTADPARVPPQITHHFKTWLPKQLLENHGVVCFTQAWSNPVLWAHYAEQHAGIVLGLDIQDGPDIQLLPVTYVREKKERDVTAPLEPVWKLKQERRDMTNEERESAEPIIRDMVSVKFADWAYEEEVRVLTDLQDKDEGLFFIDFEDKIRIAEVILGMKCPLEISEIQNDLAGHPQPIKIMRAAPSPLSFKVLEAPFQTVLSTSLLAKGTRLGM